MIQRDTKGDMTKSEDSSDVVNDVVNGCSYTLLWVFIRDYIRITRMW
jgi:hypothetical protein